MNAAILQGKHHTVVAPFYHIPLAKAIASSSTSPGIAWVGRAHQGCLRAHQGCLSEYM